MNSDIKVYDCFTFILLKHDGTDGTVKMAHLPVPSVSPSIGIVAAYSAKYSALIACKYTGNVPKLKSYRPICHTDGTERRRRTIFSVPSVASCFSETLLVVPKSQPILLAGFIAVFIAIIYAIFTRKTLTLTIMLNPALTQTLTLT